MSKKVPIPVERALRALGNDIADARKLRRIPTDVMAERAGIARKTLNRIEKGESGVSIGNVATVLFVLGLSDNLSRLASLENDATGLGIAEQNLPKRIHRKRLKQNVKKTRDGDEN
ncbi:MAG TPA: helix-turn-helix transcriptional regulator [Aridibacter sp.]|nr:helix-turn-helix transcriptional regulator [Aridibacter sp.]